MTNHNKGPKDLPQNKLPRFNLKLAAQLREKNSEVTLNPRCSRYVAQTGEERPRCKTSLSSNIQEILSHSNLDRVVNKSSDIKYMQKIEKMTSRERKEIIHLLYNKLSSEGIEESKKQIKKILRQDIDDEMALIHIIDRLDAFAEVKLIEYMMQNISASGRREIQKLLKKDNI